MRMGLGLRIRLSAMMFLEFFVWGAWYSVLSIYLQKSTAEGGLGLDATQNGTIYGLLAFASIFMPLIAGQFTDRWMPSQIFLAIAHLVGAGGLYLAARSTSYGAMYTGILLWAVTFAPTLSLVNSLSFSHLKDPERDFGPIRVFGTLGWIAAGMLLLGVRNALADPGNSWHARVTPIWEFLGKPTGNDCLYLGAAAAALMGLYCFTLPHTPPAKTGVSPFAFLKALALFGKPRVAIFLIISFVVGTELPFYFNLTGPYLMHLGYSEADIPGLMTIAQWAEIITMLALPLFLKTIGPRKTLFIGVLAWPVRYLVFAAGQPRELVVGALALHGLCFVCFFVVAFIYIDTVAPKDIKASAQGLITLVIYGFGMWLGSHFSGYIQAMFTSNGQTDWTKVFLVPSGITIACALILFFTFPRGSIRDMAPEEPADQLVGSGTDLHV
jgi:nucleoside transporter